MKRCYIIAGTSTNVGKTYATQGLNLYLSKLTHLSLQCHTNTNVVETAKIIQTGDDNDLQLHQNKNQLNNKQYNYIHLAYPASAHLAASVENYQFDVRHLEQQVWSWITNSKADYFLIELSGGIYMPIVSSFNEQQIVSYNQTDLIQFVLKQCQTKSLATELILVSDLKLGCLNACYSSMMVIDNLLFTGVNYRLLINLYSQQELNLVNLDNIQQLIVLAANYGYQVGLLTDKSYQEQQASITVSNFIQKLQLEKLLNNQQLHNLLLNIQIL